MFYLEAGVALVEKLIINDPEYTYCTVQRLQKLMSFRVRKVISFSALHSKWEKH